MYLRTFARVVEANFPPGKKLSTCARVDDFLETNFTDSLISHGQTRKKTLHYYDCQNSPFHDFSSHMNFILISNRVNHFLFRILRTLDVRSGPRLIFTFLFFLIFRLFTLKKSQFFFLLIESIWLIHVIWGELLQRRIGNWVPTYFDEWPLWTTEWQTHYHVWHNSILLSKIHTYLPY